MRSASTATLKTLKQMKNLFLYGAIAATALTASANVANLSQNWAKSVESTLESGTINFDAPVAVDVQGNLYAAGAISKDATVGGEAIATEMESAYILKYDKAGDAKWTVAITGAARVSALDCDDDGNLYAAINFADEIELGSTSGAPTAVQGLETQSRTASILTKYSPEGKLLAFQKFVPAKMIDSIYDISTDTEIPYDPEDGDMYFRIYDVKAAAGKVLAAAVFTNKTTVDGTTFESSYYDIFGFVQPLAGYAVLSMDTDIANCVNVASATVSSPLSMMTDDIQYRAYSAVFAADGDKVYVAFTGCGPLTVASGTESTRLDLSTDDFSGIFLEVAAGVASAPATKSIENSSQDNPSTFGAAAVLGSEFVAVGESKTSYTDGVLIAYSAAASDIGAGDYKTFDATDGTVSYITPASAAAVTGKDAQQLYLCVRGSFNSSADADKQGKASETTRSYVYEGGSLSAASTVADAAEVASKWEYVAFSQAIDGGNAFSLYTNPDSAGVDEIVGDGSDDAVEFYNMQGMKVSSPGGGIFIRRQGGKSEKIFVK